MSTTDPDAAAVARRRSRVGSRRALAMYAVASVVLTLSAIVLGVGIVAAADWTRQSMLDSQSDVRQLRLAPLDHAVTVGVLGVVFSWFFATELARSATGRVRSFPGIGPFTLVICGAAAGVIVTAPFMTEPAHVGAQIDPLTLVRTPWSTWDWIWYRFDVWAPSLAIMLAAVALGVSVVVRRRAAIRRSTLRRLLDAGHVVHGVVTNAPGRSLQNAEVVGTVTVRFTDAAGTARWVQQHAAFRVWQLPVVGQLASVVFDPATPSDTASIWAAPADSTTLDDFLRWRLNG